MPPEIPAPSDVAYSGEIILAVDATDTTHGILRVHESIPISLAGPTILLYSRWLPAIIRPTGRLRCLPASSFRRLARKSRGRRDAVDVFAFHVDVPNGVTSLDVDFQYLSPV